MHLAASSGSSTGALIQDPSLPGHIGARSVLQVSTLGSRVIGEGHTFATLVHRSATVSDGLEITAHLAVWVAVTGQILALDVPAIGAYETIHRRRGGNHVGGPASPGGTGQTVVLQVTTAAIIGEGHALTTLVALLATLGNSRGRATYLAVRLAVTCEVLAHDIGASHGIESAGSGKRVLASAVSGGRRTLEVTGEKLLVCLTVGLASADEFEGNRGSAPGTPAALSAVGVLATVDGTTHGVGKVRVANFGGASSSLCSAAPLECCSSPAKTVGT